MTKLNRWFAAGLVLLSTGAMANDELRYDPQAMAWLCAPCHGTDGREFHESMPALAGLDKDYFIRAMNEFKDGTRPTVIMDRVARGFTQQEIEAMAAWFAKQPATQWDAEVNYE